MRSRRALPGWPRDAVFARLRELRSGELVVVDAAGEHRFGAPGDLRATIAIHDPSFYRRLVLGGSVGGIEAYADGSWDCDDLVAVFRMFVRDMDVTDRIEGGAARVGATL